MQEEAEEQEPQIICSLGLVAERGRSRCRSNAERVRQHLADFDLEPLFIEELGWDRYAGRLDVAVDGEHVHAAGRRREARAWSPSSLAASTASCPTTRPGARSSVRSRESVHEHLIVYTDDARTTQVWQWVRREPGRADRLPRAHLPRGQSGEALIQKLDALAFSLDEEAELTIVDVTQRARAAFDVERVTKRFYDRFKAEHDAFLGFITRPRGAGRPSSGTRR